MGLKADLMSFLQAYFETYEQTKRTNEQLLRDLKDRQKELQKQLVDAQKRSRSVGGQKGKDAAADETKVADELIRKRAEYDKLKNKSQSLRSELEKLQSDLVAVRAIATGSSMKAGQKEEIRSKADLLTTGSLSGTASASSFRLAELLGEDETPEEAVEAVKLSGSVSAASMAMAALKDTALMKKAKAVEARLDKTALKYEEVTSIRKTYEGIVKRLRDERQSYDAQVSALEKELAAKNRDFQELQTLAADAVRAFETAQQELARVRAAAAGDRDRQGRELKERESMAKARKKHADAQMARERARRDLLAEVAGDLGVSEERALVASVEAARAQRNSLNDQAGVVKRKLEAYESAWRRIREATGVSEISEVTAKMAAQVEQHASLAALSRDNAARIEALRDEIAAFAKLVQELRFSSGELAPGEGGFADSRMSTGGESGTGGEAFGLTTGGSGMTTAEADAEAALMDQPRNSEEALLSSALAKLEGLREMQAALASKLVELRMGVTHLVDAIAPVRYSMGAPPLPTVDSDNLAQVVRDAGVSLKQIIRLMCRHFLAHGVDLLDGSGGLALTEPEIADLAASDEVAEAAQALELVPAAVRAARRLQEESSSLAMTDTPDLTRPVSASSRAEGEGERPSAAAGLAAGRRPETPGGTGMSATFSRMMLSPHALALLGLDDRDLLAARNYNTRIPSSNTGGVAMRNIIDTAPGAGHKGMLSSPPQAAPPSSAPAPAPTASLSSPRVSGATTSRTDRPWSPKSGGGRGAGFHDEVEGGRRGSGGAGASSGPASTAAAEHAELEASGAGAGSSTDAGAPAEQEAPGSDGVPGRDAIKKASKRTTEAFRRPAGASGPVLRKSGQGRG